MLFAYSGATDAKIPLFGRSVASLHCASPELANTGRNVITQLTASFVFARIDRATGIRASDGVALDCKRLRCT